MLKVFISQPMNNLNINDIKTKRKELSLKIQNEFNEPIEIIDSFFEDDANVDPVKILSKSIDKLAEADIVYFGGDWRNARGCKIEHRIAMNYNIKSMYEKE